MTGYITRKIFYRALTLVFFIIACSTFTFAQEPCEGPGCPPCEDGSIPEPGADCTDNPQNVPIDGGASILIAAGVAYGLKKVYDKRKQNKETDIV